MATVWPVPAHTRTGNMPLFHHAEFVQSPILFGSNALSDLFPAFRRVLVFHRENFGPPFMQDAPVVGGHGLEPVRATGKRRLRLELHRQLRREFRITETDFNKQPERA